MIYMLIDPLYFAVSLDHIGRTVSNITVVSYIAGLLYAPVAGRLFDVFMRKKTLFLSSILGAVCVFIAPFTSPYIILMVILRVLVQMSITQMMCHPLIMDYIKEESRGRASALQNLGTLLGEIFCMACLFSISKHVPTKQGFLYGALILGAMSCVLLCIVKDSTIKDKKLKSQTSDESIASPSPAQDADESNPATAINNEASESNARSSLLAA